MASFAKSVRRGWQSSHAFGLYFHSWFPPCLQFGDSLAPGAQTLDQDTLKLA